MAKKTPIPYFQAGGITIYCGDSMKIMPRLKDMYDLVFADPPYGVDKAEWDSVFPLNWIPLAFGLSPRLLCASGNSALMQAGNAFGFFYKDLIILRSLNGMTYSPIAFGNYIPVIAAGDWTWKARPNLIEFVVTTEEDIPHPSPKPLSAMRALFNHYTESDWHVIDPFMGSGTTLVAAQDFGLRATGIELDEDHCKLAVERLRQPSFFSIPKGKKKKGEISPDQMMLLKSEE